MKPTTKRVGPAKRIQITVAVLGLPPQCDIFRQRSILWPGNFTQAVAEEAILFIVSFYLRRIPIFELRAKVHFLRARH